MNSLQIWFCFLLVGNEMVPSYCYLYEKDKYILWWHDNIFLAMQ
jgi:hypothetical protein